MATPRKSKSGKSVKRLPSINSIMLHAENYDGYCIACMSWTADQCEPDAREYECPRCGQMKVYGAEELAFMIFP